MENGVEKQGETKTADGGVSQFKLVDNVVQVFHPNNDNNNKDEDEQQPPSLFSPSEETKTADGAVSQFKLVDNVVHVFHEKKDSERDDIFEDAMMDNSSPPQPQEDEEKEEEDDDIRSGVDTVDSSEVNGKLDTLVYEAGNLEDAVNADFSSEDQNVEENVATVAAVEPIDEVNIANGVSSVKEVLSEELPDTLACDLEGDGKETSAVDVNAETKSFPNDGIESSGNCDPAVHGDFGNGDDGKAVDDDDKKEPQLEESLEAVVSNWEEVKNKASTLVANGETKPSTIDEVESNKSSGAVVHGKSDQEDFKNLNLEDKPVFHVKSSEVSRSNSVDFSLSGGNELGEQEYDHRITSDYDAQLHGKSENGSTEIQDVVKLESEEKPPTLVKISDIDKAGSDEITASEGNQSVKKIFSQEDDHIHETRDMVDTILNEDIQKPELKNAPNNLGASIDVRTDMKKELADSTTPKRVRTDAAESEEIDPHILQARKTSENTEEGSGNLAAVNEPNKLQKINDEPKKADSASMKESQDSGSAREPEIQPATESLNAPPPRRPAGLGGAAPLFEPAPRGLQQPRVNGAVPQRQAQLVDDTVASEAEENDETREKLQMIRVKFLRLAHRLGQTPHNVVVAQVLYRLGLAEQLRGRNAGRVGAFSFDRASAMAEQLESAGQEPLEFSCTIMVIGKTGVGKSATINSIFDEIKFRTDAFQMGTKKVQDVVGTVQGIKVRVIDTPGLLPCWSDQRQNEKILHSVKRFIKRTPPDIVLYLDRLDMQSRDFGDLPLLRTITEIFGPSIWFNAIVVLTHAASAPPDGPNGISSSYEMFVTQRSHVVQQAIRQAAGDMRLMNPVSLVENHSACRTNRAGQRVLPNGQVWKPHLLLLSFASKILAEANTLLKLQDNPPGKPFATRPRVPPLPVLLSSLLQSRPQLKLPEEQFGDEDDLDEDLDESSDSDDESEYDELPPFKRLTKVQLAKLSKAQKKAYFEELEYREKLFMKRQLREEKKRRKILKKMAGLAREVPNDYTESAEEESGSGASVPVAMPDFSLPASFDSDNPSHRYRFLDTSNPWLVRPVLETHGWDHDIGYEGINVERLFAVKGKIPVSFSGQGTKDKKESNIQLELASSIKHNEGKATSVGFEMQPIGKDMSYTLRSETRFSNFRHNKTAAGLSVSLVGDALVAGVKVEDGLVVKKRFRLVVTGGAMSGRGGDVAYGGSLEATLRDKDYPLGRMLSTLGLSIMDWHGDLAIGCNLQSQFPIGRSSNLISRFNLNNRGSGQISIRLNSSEQLQIALVSMLPLLRKAISLYEQTVSGE